jgi:SAM-dependent methyltransferase
VSAPPRIFDRKTYRLRRARAAAVEGDLFLVEAAAHALGERLQAVNRRFTRALDLGSRRAGFETLRPLADSWTRAGLVAEASAGTAGVVADEEALPFADESFDLVTSVLSLHAINDLPGALVQIRRALKPDGLFMAALFGGETLTELRQSFARGESEVAGGVSPHVAPFADIRSLGALLQRAGFALPVADAERHIVRYRDVARLFEDLRAMGETNTVTGRRTAMSSHLMVAAALDAYRKGFAEPDGRVRATFDIVYLTGWAPHESQQQPLRPGSARARLADALGTEERSTGEKPNP